MYYCVSFVPVAVRSHPLFAIDTMHDHQAMSELATKTNVYYLLI